MDQRGIDGMLSCKSTLPFVNGMSLTTAADGNEFMMSPAPALFGYGPPSNNVHPSAPAFNMPNVNETEAANATPSRTYPIVPEVTQDIDSQKTKSYTTPEDKPPPVKVEKTESKAVDMDEEAFTSLPSLLHGRPFRSFPVAPSLS